MPKVDKVVVTNRSALKAKYTPVQVARIDKAVGALVAADVKRGLTTVVVNLDDAKQMKAYGAPAVTNPTSARQVKRAIDALFRKDAPDYLMILGAPDVVPHVDLTDPTGHDTSIPSDLPYACTAGYSTEPEKFRDPSRVVGRVPDKMSTPDEQYLVDLLGVAAGWKSDAPATYASPFGLSASAWQQSTTLSLKNVFGAGGTLHLSPPITQSAWTQPQLRSRSHFINCHGAVANPFFYGDPGGQPPAYFSGNIAGKIAGGTVAAVECCYGAQLYDPALSQAGICTTYLGEGAFAYFGSTTIAYGPPAGNGEADVICQRFLRHVMSGASTGRAAQQARLDYLASVTTLAPTDIKTLAQFILLGDPSIHPVKPSTITTGVKAIAKGFSDSDLPSGRASRRVRAQVAAEVLAQSVGWSLPASSSAQTKSVREAIAQIEKESGFQAPTVRTYDVQLAPTGQKIVAKAFGLSAKGKSAKSVAMPQVRFHLVTPKDAIPPPPPQTGPSPVLPKSATAKATDPPPPPGGGPSPVLPKRIPSLSVYVLREEDGVVVSWKELAMK
jgi:hypothetical protein